MRAVSMTRGSIAKGIVLFAFPLLGTSIVQQLYSTVDLLFVGNVLGTRSTAALGVGSLLITLLVGLFTGLSVGANVKVAHAVGAGDRALTRRTVATSMAMALASGVVLALLGMVLAGPFVDAMEVPVESIDDALAYTRFAVLAALPIGVYNIASGALRGLGDSSSPLIAQVVGGLANIAANWFALCVLDSGITGCAAATFCSNGVAAAIAVALLGRSRALARDGAGTVFDGMTGKAIMLFGLPIALQTVAITFSNIAVQHQIDLFGVDAIAAFAVYLKVELPIYFFILAIGQATTTFVAQNHGAGLHERCSKGVWTCQVLCLAITVVMSVAMLAVGYWAFWLFDRSEAVIAVGITIITTTFPFYFLYDVLEVQADAMRGFGHSLGPALVVLANICVLRVVLVFALTAQGFGIQAIAATYPITWATTAMCMVVLRVVMNRARK